jgi:hypothetical protein
MSFNQQLFIEQTIASQASQHCRGTRQPQQAPLFSEHLFTCMGLASGPTLSLGLPKTTHNQLQTAQLWKEGRWATFLSLPNRVATHS